MAQAPERMRFRGLRTDHRRWWPTISRWFAGSLRTHHPAVPAGKPGWARTSISNRSRSRFRGV